MDAFAFLPPVGAFLAMLAFALLTRRTDQLARTEKRLRQLIGRPSRVRARRAWYDRLAPYARVLIGGETDRREIGAALRAAGLYGQSAPLVFGLARLLATAAALAASLLALSVAGSFEGRWRMVPLLAAGCTYLGAKRGLGMLAAARLRRIAMELPFMLDMLLLMLESGSSLDQCFRHLGQTDAAVAPQTQAVMRVLVEDIQKGTPYDKALLKWGERLGVDGGRELAALFRQALMHGTDIAEALQTFAREFTDRRLSAARESVGRKAAQLSGAMMVFFVPALFILLGGPAASSLMSALKGISE
jgi:tight adherence protein C